MILEIEIKHKRTGRIPKITRLYLKFRDSASHYGSMKSTPKKDSALEISRLGFCSIEVKEEIRNASTMITAAGRQLQSGTGATPTLGAPPRTPSSAPKRGAFENHAEIGWHVDFWSPEIRSLPGGLAATWTCAALCNNSCVVRSNGCRWSSNLSIRVSLLGLGSLCSKSPVRSWSTDRMMTCARSHLAGLPSILLWLNV